MKIIIINFNRLSTTKNIVDWAISMLLEPIIIDNNSTYPPLLKYYAKQPCKVIRLKKNNGHKVLWDNPILFSALNIKENYIVTDSDLDCSTIPIDFLGVLQNGLKKHPSFNKVGLSLEINDLPETEFGKAVKEWEKQFWAKPLDNTYFEAWVDTTFALYRNTQFSIDKSLRVNRPYTAKHIPWYVGSFNSLNDEELYYLKTANSSATWKNKMPSNYIVSTYLTSVKDAQRGKAQPIDDSNYIEKWYNSIKNQKVLGVILHDGLSDNFISKYPEIKFVKFPSVPKNMSIYDYRWHIGYEFAKTIPIDNIFFTDLSDVTMINNPFLSPEYAKGVLYCGDEPCTIVENTWLQKAVHTELLNNLSGFTEVWKSNKKVVNPGVLGGDKETVLNFLKAFTELLMKVKTRPFDGTVDMGVFNYLMRKQFNPTFGFPVNTVFKYYQTIDNVWFKHK